MKKYYCNFALLMLGMIAVVSCGSRNESASQPASLDSLAGRWARTDGDYMIEVKGIGADGKVDAAYFNPRPIHVARAEATREGDSVKLFVELRDTGYPGCLYKLTLDKTGAMLAGTYFQAAQNETFDVIFERLK